MKRSPLLLLSCCLLLFTSCGGSKDATISEFEQNIDAAKQSEFLEEGMTLADLAKPKDGELPAGEVKPEESLIDALKGLGNTVGGAETSKLEVVKQMSQDIEKAKKQSQTDPELARLTLSHVQDTMGYLERTMEKNALPEVQESMAVVKNDAIELQHRLDNVVVVDKPTVLADLTNKLSENLEGGVVKDGKWFLYTARSIITSPDPAFSSLERKDFAPDVKVVSATAFPYNNTIVFGLTPSKVAEYANGTISVIDMKDQKGGAISQVLNYTNRRFLYILDPSSNQIWKYTRGTDTYQFPAGAVGRDAQLSDAVSIAIDGNIFALRSTGEINRYFNGDFRDDFRVSNPPSNYRMPTDPKSILMTREELHNVYVLNHGLKTVFVYQKDSFSNTRAFKYLKQFSFTDEVVDISVDASEQELVVVTTKKIMKVPLGL